MRNLFTVNIKSQGLKNLGWYLAVTSVCMAFGPNSHSETLLEVYELALKNDRQYQADLATYRASRELETIDRSALLPQITLSGRHLDQKADDSDSETNTETTTFSLNLQQALIDFSAYHQFRRGKLQTQSAETQLQASQQRLIIRSAQAYFDVLRAVDQLRTAKAEEKALATQLEQTQQRFEVGLIPINDVQETRAAFDSAVADRFSSELNLIISLEALTILTAENHDSIAPLHSNFITPPPVPNDKQAWIDTAIKNNLALRTSKLAADIAAYNNKAARGDRYPTLTGTLSYGSQDSSVQQNGSTLNDSDEDVTSVRLDLSIPLFTGGRLRALDRQAAENEIRAREEFLLARRNAIQRTRAFFFAVNTDINQVKARKQAIVSNESALEATRAGYQAGTRDIVDLVDAQSNLFQAQRDYYTTLYDYIINSLNLKNESGVLSVKDLKELENSLAENKAIDIAGP